MGKRDVIGGAHGLLIEDVGGSFARFLKQAPKEARKRMSAQVLVTASKLQDRIAAGAPVGPDAPHLKNAVTFKHRGLSAQVGYLAEDFGNDPANDVTPQRWKGDIVTNAMVALFNEYNPNKQPFMRPAAEGEAKDYVRRMTAALGAIERALRV